MPSAVCQRHGVALDRAELVETMKCLLACLALCASFNVSAQLPAPQNGDMDGDGHIGAGDILALLGSYGMSVTPAICPQANLSGADLTGAYLQGANLQGANLSGANLHGAYLSGADLSYADLSYAFVFDAYLQGANLTGATMNCLDIDLGCSFISVPTGYTCEPDPDCSEPNRYRIVPE